MKARLEKGRPRTYNDPTLMTAWVEQDFLDRANAQAKKEATSRAILLQSVVTNYIKDREFEQELKSESGKPLPVHLGDGVSFVRTASGVILRVRDREYPLSQSLSKKIYLLSR